MDSWLPLGLWAACFTAGPATSLNEPRPHEAQPVPSSVIPAGHTQLDDDSASQTMIPPAPLPEFSDEETPMFRFEFAPPESCRDSAAILPAPPAERPNTGAPFPEWKPKTRRSEVWVGSVQPRIIVCDEEEGPLGASIPLAELHAAPPALEGPRTVDQVRHLHQAIQQLKAAGMTHAAQALQAQYRDSAARLRGDIDQSIQAKEAEILRMQEEIEQLKQILASDESATKATLQIEFRENRPLRLTFSDELPSPEWDLAPSPAPEILEAQPVLPFQLIPSPTTNGRPNFLFPMSPMRTADDPSVHGPFQLRPVPSVPLPNESDSDLEESDEGPVI